MPKSLAPSLFLEEEDQNGMKLRLALSEKDKDTVRNIRNPKAEDLEEAERTEREVIGKRIQAVRNLINLFVNREVPIDFLPGTPEEVFVQVENRVAECVIYIGRTGGIDIESTNPVGKFIEEIKKIDAKQLFLKDQWSEAAALLQDIDRKGEGFPELITKTAKATRDPARILELWSFSLKVVGKTQLSWKQVMNVWLDNDAVTLEEFQEIIRSLMSDNEFSQIMTSGESKREAGRKAKHFNQGSLAAQKFAYFVAVIQGREQ